MRSLSCILAAYVLWGPQVAKCQNPKPTTPVNQAADKKPVEPTHIVVEGQFPTIRAEIKSNDQGAVEKPLPRFLRPEWIIVYVTAAYALVALWTLKAIKQQAEEMSRQANTMEQQLADARVSSEQQSKGVQASIAEAAKSAQAMEEVARSMISSAESTRQSVTISREIADTQKIAIELQSRAYLSVFFDGAVYQDANHVFEVIAVIRNHGNTPAYDVVFRTTAQIIPVPIPDSFAYELPSDSAGTSVSLMAPGTTKLITSRVRERIA